VPAPYQLHTTRPYLTNRTYRENAGALVRNQLIGGHIEQTPYGWDAAGFWIHDVPRFRVLMTDSWTRGWSRQATRVGHVAWDDRSPVQQQDQHRSAAS
jgi:hypothetical protein